MHEIGLDIAHNNFQRHGAYIAANADLPGFPRSEQKLLAYLVASQRSDLSRSNLGTVPSKLQKSALRLAILLRLAVLLHRNRSKVELPEIRLIADRCGIRLKFPPGWLEANPLTITDLEREQQYLAAMGYDLNF